MDIPNPSRIEVMEIVSIGQGIFMSGQKTKESHMMKMHIEMQLGRAIHNRIEKTAIQIHKAKL